MVDSSAMISFERTKKLEFGDTDDEALDRDEEVKSHMNNSDMYEEDHMPQ
jgi:hypothetical protein